MDPHHPSDLFDSSAPDEVHVVVQESTLQELQENTNRRGKKCVYLLVLITFLFVIAVILATSLSDLETQYLYIILIILIFVLPLIFIYFIFCCTGRSKNTKYSNGTMHIPDSSHLSHTNSNQSHPTVSVIGGLTNQGFASDHVINTTLHRHQGDHSLPSQLQSIEQYRSSLAIPVGTAFTLTHPPPYDAVIMDFPPPYDNSIPPPYSKIVQATNQ